MANCTALAALRANPRPNRPRRALSPLAKTSVVKTRAVLPARLSARVTAESAPTDWLLKVAHI